MSVPVVCCVLEITASGWSLVQKVLPRVGCLLECDREASIKRRPLTTATIAPWKRNLQHTEVESLQ